MGNQHAPAWGERKVSSYSDGANNCIEVAHSRGQQLIGIWDSKNVVDDHVEVSPTAWAAFQAYAKRI